MDRTLNWIEEQLESDLVSINHRVAALIASYFDITFVVTHLPHLGEKRLMQFAKSYCNKLPKSFKIDFKIFLAHY